jgi:ATP-dependent protease ClpP protease subunit
MNRKNYNNKSDMQNNGMDELFSLDFMPQSEKSVKHFRQSFTVNNHSFYLVEDIGEPKFYLNMLHTIRTAEEHDTIFIHLNTRGGNLYTAVQIINAIRTSRAVIITSLEGEVCSAGTMIFLAGQHHMVAPNSSFMIHNYSQWLGGKGNEIQQQVRHTESFFKDFADSIYGGFLTEEEIASVLDGRDIWMKSTEVVERVKDKLIDLTQPQKVDDGLKDMLDALAAQQAEEDAEDEEEEVEELPPQKPKKKVATKSVK